MGDYFNKKEKVFIAIIVLFMAFLVLIINLVSLGQVHLCNNMGMDLVLDSTIDKKVCIDYNNVSGVVDDIEYNSSYTYGIDGGFYGSS